MFLICPQCSTKYLVDPSAIGKTGREVRCAKCAHSWFQAPPEEMPAPELVLELEPQGQRPRPIPEGSSLPVVVEEKSVSAGLKFAAVAMVLLALVSSFVYFRPQVVSAVPALQSLYDGFGMYATEGLVIADLDIKKSPVNKNKDQYQISMKVINQSKEERRLPVIRLDLSSEVKSGRLFDIEPKEPVTLKPGEVHLIEERGKSNFVTAKKVSVVLGNPLELMLR